MCFCVYVRVTCSSGYVVVTRLLHRVVLTLINGGLVLQKSQTQVTTPASCEHDTRMFKQSFYRSLKDHLWSDDHCARLPSGGSDMGGLRQYMWYPRSQSSQNRSWSWKRGSEISQTNLARNLWININQHTAVTDKYRATLQWKSD